MVFKLLKPSILRALAPPIIEAFADAKTKEDVSKGPLVIGWHEAINEPFKSLIIEIFFLFIYFFANWILIYLTSNFISNISIIDED